MSSESDGAFVTELRARGYAVLPAPRKVELNDGSVRVEGSWGLDAAGAEGNGIAARTLIEALSDEHGLKLAGRGGAGGTIHLVVKPGAIPTGREPEVDRQGYRLTVAPGRVEVLANAPAGLFYGVQTLLQLLDGDGRGKLVLPEGTIADWPEYQLRFVHWDTKHHQDRMETLKRFLDWMARFKLNAVSFELEDKFEYPSHPIIGAPGAFTLEQLQELTRYGLERHIQIVPNIQAPAHMCYVLKHEQFSHLRCDGSNYQSCMDDPAVRKLIFQMYDDACQATPGVEYFHVSTDEVYYAGICEKYRRPYNPTNRSLTWVEFVKAAHEHLARRGRKVIIWLEYPLLTEHVKLLPAEILDGILSPGKDAACVKAEDEHGIRQLAYCPIQGMELLFPDYFARAEGQGGVAPGRLSDAVRATSGGHARKESVVGMFVAAWDDSGLHNETFWLGWAVMAAGGWTPGAARVEQTVADFMEIYYGRGPAETVEIYRDMQEQARFWEAVWDHRPSKVRGPGYGFSGGKRPTGRTDCTLLPPALPRLPDLGFTAAFSSRYEAILRELPARLEQNDRLIARLQSNLPRAARNRYNLEVLLSLAYLVRHFLELLAAVARAEGQLSQAAGAAKAGQHARAVALMVQARRGVAARIDGLYATYRRLEKVWEESRYPRNVPVGGKQFLHVMDDVKDHFADRRADLSYMIAPEESIGLKQWCEALGKVMRTYAAEHDVPVAGLADGPMDD